MTAKSNAPQSKLKGLGMWSAVGTFLLMAVGAYATNGFGKLAQDVPLFFTGSLERVEGASFHEMLPYGLGLIVVGLITVIPVGMLTEKIAGVSKSHKLLELLLPGTEKRLFASLFLSILLVEEGVCREEN